MVRATIASAGYRNSLRQPSPAPDFTSYVLTNVANTVKWYPARNA